MGKYNIEYLEKEKEFEEKIKARVESYVSDIDSHFAITDGAFNIEKYFTSPVRILWLLKEAFDDWDDEGNPVGGNFSISDCLYGVNGMQNTGYISPTFQKMIYCIYGIFYGEKYENMPYAKNIIDLGSAKYKETLERVVHINANKLAALSSSNDNEVVSNFMNHWQDIVKEQIDYYVPDVIICGGSAPFTCLCNIMPNLKTASKVTRYVDSKVVVVQDDKSVLDKYSTVDGYYVDGKIILYPYHPGCRKDEEVYVDGVVETVKVLRSLYTV